METIFKMIQFIILTKKKLSFFSLNRFQFLHIRTKIDTKRVHKLIFFEKNSPELLLGSLYLPSLNLVASKII